MSWSPLILVSRRARRAKTDRLDAEGLLRVLAAYDRGDRQVCSVLRVPTPEEEDAKRPHREREYLVQERIRIENRIEALLFAQGVRRRPSLRAWDAELAALRTADGRALPPHLRGETERLKRRLVLVGELIREIEAERAAALAAEAPDEAATKIVALTRIRGIGRCLRGRADPRGLLPPHRQPPAAGKLCRRGTDAASEPRHGPRPADRPRREPAARRTLIQLAWLWLRYQPASGLAGWFRDRVGAPAGRTRRIAILAMARKLLVALWRYVETGLVPEGMELKA
jgi:transposase